MATPGTRARFGRSHKSVVDDRRLDILSIIQEFKQLGDGIGAEGARRLGHRLSNAVMSVCDMPLSTTRPPAVFAELRTAMWENLQDRGVSSAAADAIDDLEKLAIETIKSRYPGLRRVDLGADDLLEMARQGILMSSEFSTRARELKGEGMRQSLLERVRSRLSQAEVERLEWNARDVDPRTSMTEEAVAAVALAAFRARLDDVPVPLDPNARVAPRDAVAPRKDHLMKLAADMSCHLSDEKTAWLRLAVAASGRSVVLAADIRRAESEQAPEYAWMARR